ncbi:hypothetical protein CAL26_19450 [Bordetella genomosp. 9]|uniref:DUF2946 domain-containing protein n=2 Tax=Bordetella genomosp. 9 TaxID=1416803 RepID=A0A261R402_9BORD|nr:hypothetical protein CAL26_19450 [Bordetella genomosp. 9]
MRRVDSGTRLMLCLLLLAVSLRAMIPVGYMPDTAALRHGVVRISLCTSTGAVSVLQLITGAHANDPHDHGQPDAGLAPRGDAGAGHAHMAMPGMAHGGHDHDSDSDHMAGAECPFWASAHLAADLPTLALTPFLVAVRDEAVRFVAPAELPPLPPAGPPLGSRAPPLA